MDIVQQKVEEARKEVAAGDQARQTAVQDTSLFAGAEVLVEIPPQPHGLDPRPRDALTSMMEVLNNMKARQQQQQPQQAQIPGLPLTPTVTQGSEPFKGLPVTQEADLMQAIRQAQSSASGQDQETDQRKSKKMGIPTTEELQGGLRNCLGEQWTGMDEGLKNRLIQAVNQRIAPYRPRSSSPTTRTAKLKYKSEFDGDTA